MSVWEENCKIKKVKLKVSGCEENCKIEMEEEYNYMNPHVFISCKKKAQTKSIATNKYLSDVRTFSSMILSENYLPF